MCNPTDMPARRSPPPSRSLTQERPCPCGYQPSSASDRDDHIMSMMSVVDGSHHA